MFCRGKMRVIIWSWNIIFSTFLLLKLTVFEFMFSELNLSLQRGPAHKCVLLILPGDSLFSKM